MWVMVKTSSSSFFCTGTYFFLPAVELLAGVCVFALGIVDRGALDFLLATYAGQLAGLSVWAVGVCESVN